MRLLDRPPDELSIDSLTGHNTLLVGAPYIGKSHLFQKTADNTIFTRVRSIDDALDTRPGEFVVLDGFYRAYQAASENDRTAFESWLDRGGGVCVVTRPYDIDWLLNSADVPLTDEILEAFDQACLLRYAPDDDAERERAVQRCLSIGREEAEAAVTREDVTAAIDDLFAIPGYEFTNAGLRDRIGIDSYDETLLPALVVYFSDRLDENERAILSGGVRDACAGILENVSVAQFFTETKDACRALFSRDTLSDLGTDFLTGSPGPAVSAASVLGGGAAAAPSALVAGGSLALYWHLRDEPDDTLDTEAVFGPLLGEELTPPARARLEADLEVPPRTIDNFRRVVRGDTAEQFVANRDRLAAVDERLDTVEQAVTRYETDLRRLDAVVDALDAVAIDHSDLVGFVTEAIAEATGDIDDFREAVRAEERTNVLQVESIETLPQYYGDGDARLIELVGDDETELIVLRGAHGTGKTTAAYRACELLARSGYDVRLPNLETSSRDAIRYGLTATGDETVAVVAYHRGMADANTLRSARDLRQVLGWLDTDTCSTVILECREELYRSLDSLTGDIEDRRLKAIWRDATEISFDRMDEADLRQVITWTLDQLTFDGDREAIIREATRVSDGNPEIAKTRPGVSTMRANTMPYGSFEWLAGQSCAVSNG